jgi:hypothetical protein
MSKPLEEMQIPEVSDRIQVVFLDGEERELFMSFGLLNVLSQLVGGIEQLPFIYSESSMREVILITCLNERDNSGRIPELSEFNALGERLSVTQAEDILGWVEAHLAGFFIRSLKRLGKLTSLAKTQS